MNISNKLTKCTKRTVISDIAKLFDPLGLINPVVVLGKIFLQQLWKLQINWDESLPMDYHTTWIRYRTQLEILETFSAPRRLCNLDKFTQVQLHAFSDASEKAYGSCIYLRYCDSIGNVSTNLLCAKSRVAPIKHITIPRLELCAAQLMAQLVDRVKGALSIKIQSIFYWTDSTIVLSWLAECSSNWSTFVANRVANIQELTNILLWRHVDTSNNPADLLSRGMFPQDFVKSNLWLSGPSFLLDRKEMWNCPLDSQQHNSVPERRKQQIVLTVAEEVDIVESSKFINSFQKLQGVFSFIGRFIKNTRVPAPQRKYAVLQANEREWALKIIIHIIQRKSFKQYYDNLNCHQEIGTKSHLRNLCPFLNSDNIIRVGGRLKNSELAYDAKHPMLLPALHPFTHSLMTYLHTKHMHAGPQGLLYITIQRFWPLNGLNIAKRIVHSCIRCFRAKPKDITQLMGDLPPERVQPARPFINSGVDFCGPVFTHFKVRGRCPVKTYIAIFICFATKAIHLELASDMSSNAFVAALKRFVGRRGLCANLYCDNATNFIGAQRELKELYQMFFADEQRSHIIELCSKDNMNFHFIPPRSPHSGGLWEAGVKSAKYHLRRATQGNSLTYEELHTVVVQIEAILNSRPIQPMSSDPNDIQALTPGHFLIGQPLSAFVEPNLEKLHLNQLNRWQILQRIQQTFWKRWSNSYLNQLQCRNKWNQSKPNVAVGSLVLIKDDNLPPMKWILARVIEVFPGDDGKIRVVMLKSMLGQFKRSVTKICPLPIVSNTDNN